MARNEPEMVLDGVLEVVRQARLVDDQVASRLAGGAIGVGEHVPGEHDDGYVAGLQRVFQPAGQRQAVSGTGRRLPSPEWPACG